MVKKMSEKKIASTLTYRIPIMVAMLGFIITGTGKIQDIDIIYSIGFLITGCGATAIIVIPFITLLMGYEYANDVESLPHEGTHGFCDNPTHTRLSHLEDFNCRGWKKA